MRLAPHDGQKPLSAATERHDPFGVARFALDTKKSMFQATAFEVLLEFLYDVCRQVFALLLQLLLETWPVFLNDQEESRLGSMAFIVERARRTISDVGQGQGYHGLPET